MARAALLHELGEHTDFIVQSPLIRHGSQQTVTGGLALPVRDDLLFLQLEIFRSYMEADQLALVHDLHILDGVAAQFGEGRGALRILALLADDQFVIGQIQGLFGEVLLQYHGAEHRYGDSTLVLFVNFGLDLGSFQIQMRLGPMTDSS